jgi:hypothetical protein
MKPTVQFLFFVATVLILLVGCSKNQSENHNNKQLVLAATVDSISQCKSFTAILKNSDTLGDLSCIDYQYDSASNRLSIKHLNAGFNCCLEGVEILISTNNDTLFIEEIETSEHCYCLCLFDIFIQINGLEQKRYLVKFKEPYCHYQYKLIFEMDLNRFKSGIYCVQRNKYPWG